MLKVDENKMLKIKSIKILKIMYIGIITKTQGTQRVKVTHDLWLMFGPP